MSVLWCNHGLLSPLRLAVLFAVAGWSTFSSAQAIDASQPSLSDKSFYWLCQGLPLNSASEALIGGATVPAPTKKCAATIYFGKQLDTAMTNVFGLSSFVPPYSYKFGDSYFIGGSLSRVLGEAGEFAALEIESGAGQRFGLLHEEEAWIALYARWKYFPWNDYLRTSVAVSTGLSYASAVPTYEIVESGNGQGQRLLHYFSPEATFALPSKPDIELVIRYQHRSGGGEFFGNNFPIYGSLFHGIQGGVQYLTVGVRQHF
jgi:hypothetical protein